MNTPICDFVKSYADSEPLRLHMPGHKGLNLTGNETYDITEIHGADSLYESSGIIAQSEENASSLFGCETLYSTEGSSLAIRAMLFLTVLYAKERHEKPLIFAGRNAHKTFLSACVLLDFDYRWLCPENQSSYLSCKINGEYLERVFSECERKPTAVYITSPDYLGNITDIEEVAKVCHKHEVLLLVDNAHGAYLNFLSPSKHPIHLGADICCDSAHKTLPALTSAAYLHISKTAPEVFSSQAKNALSLFGSTSPSYLILESLDAVNAYLFNGYSHKLSAFISEVNKTKSRLKSKGYILTGDEPLKITVSTKDYGYTGVEIGEILKNQNIFCEFADPDFIVFMVTPETETEGLKKLEEVLLSLPQKEKIKTSPPEFSLPEKVLSARESAFLKSETIPVSESLNRVLARSTVGCPPAVPIVIGGERIGSTAIKCFKYYGINNVQVIIE